MKNIADYKAAAESALRAGNEGDARTLLEAKKRRKMKNWLRYRKLMI